MSAVEILLADGGESPSDISGRSGGAISKASKTDNDAAPPTLNQIFPMPAADQLDEYAHID